MKETRGRETENLFVYCIPFNHLQQVSRETNIINILIGKKDSNAKRRKEKLNKNLFPKILGMFYDLEKTKKLERKLCRD